MSQKPCKIPRIQEELSKCNHLVTITLKILHSSIGVPFKNLKLKMLLLRELGPHVNLDDISEIDCKLLFRYNNRDRVVLEMFVFCNCFVLVLLVSCTTCTVHRFEKFDIPRLKSPLQLPGYYIC